MCYLAIPMQFQAELHICFDSPILHQLHSMETSLVQLFEGAYSNFQPFPDYGAVHRIEVCSPLTIITGIPEEVFTSNSFSKFPLFKLIPAFPAGAKPR
jgi:hypothetical protein